MMEIISSGFSELGESACLTAAAPDGTLGGYRERVDFGAADQEVTFGRYRISTGHIHFVSLSASTPAAQNTGQPSSTLRHLPRVSRLMPT